MKKYFILFSLCYCACFFSQSGKVGINTDAPDARLQINSNGNTSSTMAMRTQNSSGLQMFNLQDNGLVGINKSTPVATLDIVGDAATVFDLLIRKPTTTKTFDGLTYTPSFFHMRNAGAGSYNNLNAGGQLFVFDNGVSSANNYNFTVTHGINIIPANTTITKKGIYFGSDGKTGVSIDRLPTTDLDIGGSIRLRENATVITAGQVCTNHSGDIVYSKGHFYGCYFNGSTTNWKQLDN